MHLSFDIASILKAGIMAQASITATLFLLRVADRRARGMGWLTGTAILSAVAMALRLPHVRQLDLVWDVPVAAACSLGALCAFFGLRSLDAVQPPVRRLWPALAVAIVASGLLLGRSHPLGALTAIRLTTMTVLIVMILMLWATRNPVLRPTLRSAAGILALFFLIPPSMVILDLCGVNFYRNSLFSRIAVVVVITLIDFTFVAAYVAGSKRRFHEGTRRDVLTGLSNRLALQEAAARHTRSNAPQAALLMLDLDHFKAVNDTWGHIAGDRALRAVSEALQSIASGEQNCVARFGGEEFAIFLPDHDAASAGRLAEQLRYAIAAIRLPVAKGVVTVTVSIGTAVLHPAESDWIPMLHRADAALYQAKNAGRNRVEVSLSSADTPPVQPARRPASRRILKASLPWLKSSWPHATPPSADRHV